MLNPVNHYPLSRHDSSLGTPVTRGGRLSPPDRGPNQDGTCWTAHRKDRESKNHEFLRGDDSGS